MLTTLVVDYPCSERDAETSGGHGYQHDSRHITNVKIKYKFRKFIKIVVAWRKKYQCLLEL